MLVLKYEGGGLSCPGAEAWVGCIAGRDMKGQEQWDIHTHPSDAMITSRIIRPYNSSWDKVEWCIPIFLPKFFDTSFRLVGLYDS